MNSIKISLRHLASILVIFNFLKTSLYRIPRANTAANQLAHQLPNEPDLGTRISQEGISWTMVAENIGFSTDTSDITATATGLNQAMLNEKPPDDGHRRNILSPQATMLGVDVILDTQHHQIWLTEDFARE